MLDNNMPCVPNEYFGREQTYLKHRVLKCYLESWAHKMCSRSKYSSQPIKLWYIDCFAGPWKSADEELKDTSVFIGLNALGEALKTWSGWNYNVSVGAVFVEKDPQAFTSLQQFLDNSEHKFPKHAFNGEFGLHIDQIQKVVGNDPAFLFVDPTGWTGAALKYIKPLALAPKRDIMVNVMYDYINRFKESPDDNIRKQISDFFDAAVPENLSEEELFAFYREQLKNVCGVKYAADLIVLDPLRDRTKFRLVVGGDHPAVLSLFRDVEKKVIGGESPGVRSTAKENSRLNKTNQGSLFNVFEAPEVDDRSRRKEREVEALKSALMAFEKANGNMTFEALKPHLLERFHMTEPELGKLIWGWYKENKLSISRTKKGERSLKDHHVISSVKFLAEMNG